MHSGFANGDRWVTLRPSLRWPRIERMRAARYLIQLELRDQVVHQQIRVSWTGCRFGGARPWLHCPYCQRRVAILVRALAGYSCRNCAGHPVYACQSKSTQARRHFEACKLRLRLGGSPRRFRNDRKGCIERLMRGCAADRRYLKVDCQRGSEASLQTTRTSSIICSPRFPIDLGAWRGACFCVARPPPNIGEHRKMLPVR
jgi:hypothetical protein